MRGQNSAASTAGSRSGIRDPVRVHPEGEDTTAVDGGCGAHVAAGDPAVVPPHRGAARQLHGIEAHAVRAMCGTGVEHLAQPMRGKQFAARQRRVEAVQVGEGGHELARRAGHARVEFGDIGPVGGVRAAVRIGKSGRGGGERGARQTEGSHDAALGLDGVRVAGVLLDDHAEHDVVGVGEAAAVGRGVGESYANGLKRSHGDGAFGVRGEFGQTAGVGEQGAQRHGPAVVSRAAHQAGQVIVHGVRQGQPVFGGQLQHDRGDEGLGDAAGAEMVGPVDSPAGAGEAGAGLLAGRQGGSGCPAPGDEQGGRPWPESWEPGSRPGRDRGGPGIRVWPAVSEVSGLSEASASAVLPV